MKFSEIVDHTISLLERKGRVSYRALQMEFDLSEDQLAALVEEIQFTRDDIEEVDGRGLRLSTQLSGDKTEITSAYESSSANSSIGDRRQLTVVFCDVVESTSLSDRLDPEALQEIIRAYQSASAQAIQKFDGYIAQYLGDGLLVYYGFPHAHEDDAERAIWSGLEILDSIRSLNAELEHPIDIRVGIHTGHVVMGEMGSGAQAGQLALGNTPNIAARIQGIAAPGQLLVSDSTAKLVRGQFKTKDLGKHELKGITEHIQLYEIASASEARGRFDAAAATGISKMVGRVEELNILRRHWSEVKNGSGQVVLISGEAGIGKSRLIRKIKEEITTEGVPRIEFHCSPYHQNSALHPIVEHLKRLLDFHNNLDDEKRYKRLCGILEKYDLPDPDAVLLLAALLSLKLPDTVEPLRMNPEQQQQRTFETLISWLLEEANRNTLFCAWEDLHWADPSTLEILGSLIEQVPRSQSLTVLSHRPEFQPPWGHRSHFVQISLTRLAIADATSLVDHVAGDTPLPANLVDQIVKKTDGVPLFVEELTKTVIESSTVDGSRSEYDHNDAIDAMTIPSTLRDSLTARLDRLGDARQLAQLGGVLGREFSYELIAACVSCSEQDLRRMLSEIVDAELIYCKGTPPRSSYLFKHALVQDVAYESLLLTQRNKLHLKVAEALRLQFPQVCNTQPELVAYHFAEAGKHMNAARLLASGRNKSRGKQRECGGGPAFLKQP